MGEDKDEYLSAGIEESGNAVMAGDRRPLSLRELFRVRVIFRLHFFSQKRRIMLEGGDNYA